jgi:hypothetical protein
MAKRSKLSTEELIRMKEEEYQKIQDELRSLAEKKVEEDKNILYSKMNECNLTIQDMVRIMEQLTNRKNQNLQQVS